MAFCRLIPSVEAGLDYRAGIWFHRVAISDHNRAVISLLVYA